MSAGKYHVGQKVWIDNVNYRTRQGDPRPRQEGVVTKVGRVLMTVDNGSYSEVYRMETGVINDQYGHRWILTPEEAADEDRKGVARKRLAEFRVVGLDWNRHSAEALEKVADILEADQAGEYPPPPDGEVIQEWRINYGDDGPTKPRPEDWCWTHYSERHGDVVETRQRVVRPDTYTDWKKATR